MKITHIIFLIFTLLSCGEVQRITTKGTSFGHNGGPNDCIIDGTKVSCNQMKKAFRTYKKVIRKCKPKWLIQYDYNGSKIAEGYAVRKSLISHHHYWLVEKMTYNEAGDTLTHDFDSTININKIKYYPAFIVRRIAIKGEIR